MEFKRLFDTLFVIMLLITDPEVMEFVSKLDIVNLMAVMPGGIRRLHVLWKAVSTKKITAKPWRYTCVVA